MNRRNAEEGAWQSGGDGAGDDGVGFHFWGVVVSRITGTEMIKNPVHGDLSRLPLEILAMPGYFVRMFK
jgi:hypothetical protein